MACCRDRVWLWFAQGAFGKLFIVFEGVHVLGPFGLEVHLKGQDFLFSGGAGIS